MGSVWVVAGRAAARVIGRRLCAGLAVCVALALVVTAPARAHVAPLPPYVYSARDAATAPGLAAPAQGSQCPSSTDPAAFESARRLLSDNAVMAGLGRRPTGSPAQQHFVDWLERSLTGIDGVQVGSVPYKVDRWVEQGSSLSAGASSGALRRMTISGAVPYAQPSPRAGANGRLVYVPPGQALTPGDVAGKIVVRDAVPGVVPNAAFRAVEWFEWDPDGTMAQDAGGNYERDFAGYNQRVTDLQDAAAGHAAGIVFVHGFPTAQVRGQYAPYEGIHWKVPALYVGVDEGERLKALAAAGGAARISLAAVDKPSPTRTLIATLPGVSDERMVVESHTDGMNAIWDNGPIAILALARHFASLPRECRPRTLQFVFTTGHIYQHLTGGDDRGGGAEQEAKQLDSDYDKGTVAMVFAMEHLGAREYAAVPRKNGPGRVLELSGRSELNTMFVGESPALIQGVENQVVSHDLRRTFVLRGADAPGLTIPPQQSYGGEGGAYQQHLLPTVALVTGPWSLYNPAFGMEAVDGDLMRKQTLLFSDLMHAFASTPAAALGGGYLGYRAARSLVCQSAFATFGLTRCAGDPYG